MVKGGREVSFCSVAGIRQLRFASTVEVNMRKLILMDKQIKEMPGRKSSLIEPFIKPCVSLGLGRWRSEPN